jgi:glycosyltransferase involved in cell wall biosynthesis
MKIAIIGSRGIPNRYGGFEELAEQLGQILQARGHEVLVFNPHHHPYNSQIYKGVQIVKRYDPRWLGSFGQFIYDFGSILSCRKIKPDIILQLGYTSSAIWYWLLPKKSKVLTNMDGMEWKRSKYGGLTKKFLNFSEFLAARNSHVLIADHPAIQEYYNQHYLNQTVYVPYGAEVPVTFDKQVLSELGLKTRNYYLVICRMEPENHIEMVLEGYKKSGVDAPLIIVGNIDNKHGKYLANKYGHQPSILFIEGIYEKRIVHALRHFSTMYFHGHSVGGTNPSLLEAMACGAHIAAHRNEFNAGVLGKGADYFENADEVCEILLQETNLESQKNRKKRNLSAIRTRYNWRIVAEQYEITMQLALLR